MTKIKAIAKIAAAFLVGTATGGLIEQSLTTQAPNVAPNATESAPQATQAGTPQLTLRYSTMIYVLPPIVVAARKPQPRKAPQPYRVAFAPMRPTDCRTLGEVPAWDPNDHGTEPACRNGLMTPPNDY